MTPARWLERLHCLAARFPEFGIGPDLATVSATDLYGVFRFLSRLTQGE